MINPFNLTSVLLLTLISFPERSLAYQKCKPNTYKSAEFACKYIIRKNKGRMVEWASAFCLNSGFQRGITNPRFKDCRINRCRSLRGSCLLKGKVKTYDKTVNCERTRHMAKCYFSFKRTRSFLRRQAARMCRKAGLKQDTNNTRYNFCSRNGRRCNTVYMQCIE